MIIEIDKKRPYVFIVEIMLFLLLFQGFYRFRVYNKYKVYIGYLKYCFVFICAE